MGEGREAVVHILNDGHLCIVPLSVGYAQDTCVASGPVLVALHQRASHLGDEVLLLWVGGGMSCDVASTCWPPRQTHSDPGLENGVALPSVAFGYCHYLHVGGGGGEGGRV